MEFVLALIGLLLAGFLFEKKEKPSDLPPFSKDDAKAYWERFDYWNKKD